MARTVVGVDLGGTNVRAQALRQDGTPDGPRVEIASHAQAGAEATVAQVAKAVRLVLDSAEERPEAVGLAVAGHVDDAEGVVRWSPNLGEERDGVFHFWVDVPFREMLARHLDLPVRMANDANAAAMGEYVFGVGRGSEPCLAMFTMGTGIGSGVVLGSASVQGGSERPLLLLGGNKGGVELGHMVVQRGGKPSSSGAYGTLEGYCQKDAVTQRAVFRLLRGVPSCLRQMCDGDFALVDPRMISEAADQGDELALDVWREVGEYLGVAIGSAINAFAPSVVTVAGQVAKAHRHFLPAAVLEARNTAIPSLFGFARIVPAEHMEDAGLLGAAALAFQVT